MRLSVVNWLTFLFVSLNNLEQIATQNFQNKHVTIRKPYEQIFEIPTAAPVPEITLIYDQKSLMCPLPYMSSSMETGCTCDFRQKIIECKHSDVLWRMPNFTWPESETNELIAWNLDLRCKNLTALSGLRGLMPLRRINVLDMSYDEENVKVLCKKSDFQSNLIGLKEFGDAGNVDKLDLSASLNETHLLEIQTLNLTGNGIKEFNMNTQTNSLNQIRVTSLNLDHNQLIILENSNWLQSTGLSHLYSSYNQLLQVDVAFLIYLKHLDLSFNKLYQFSIEFYKTADGLRNSSVTSNLEFLDFSNNQLLNLPFFYLKNIRFSNMHSLNVSNNRLGRVTRLEFGTMSNLIVLNLRANRLDTIEKDSFKNLFSVKKLDLAVNQLNQVRGDCFKDIGKSMETLILDKNRFERVPHVALKYCGKVRYFHMHDNRVKKLTDYSFGYMKNLLELYLGGNLIEEITENAFLIDPMALKGPGLLEKIDLSNNRLRVLSSNIFSYLVNLRYLMLNNNLIKSISSAVFNNVNYLITLDLSINQLTDFDLRFLSSSNFTRLRNLKLSHNKLTFIQSSQFICLSSLANLDLSFNQITKLSDCAFHGLQYSIKRLLLNYNQINQINSCSFSLEFNNLRFVQLVHNPLNCSNNCEFFFTVYRSPYSIDYRGIECVNNDFNLITTNSLKHCTLTQYSDIYKSCRRRLSNNDCLLADKISQMDKNLLGCEYQSQQQNTDTDINWTIAGNRSSLQEKHLYLYDLIDTHKTVRVGTNGCKWTQKLGMKIYLIYCLIFVISLFKNL